MTILVPIALFGWIPVVLMIFSLLPPRRAVIAAFISAWLFLPMAGYSDSGVPRLHEADGHQPGRPSGDGHFSQQLALRAPPSMVRPADSDALLRVPDRLLAVQWLGPLRRLLRSIERFRDVGAALPDRTRLFHTPRTPPRARSGNRRGGAGLSPSLLVGTEDEPAAPLPRSMDS